MELCDTEEGAPSGCDTWQNLLDAFIDVFGLFIGICRQEESLSPSWSRLGYICRKMETEKAEVFLLGGLSSVFDLFFPHCHGNYHHRLNLTLMCFHNTALFFSVDRSTLACGSFFSLDGSGKHPGCKSILSLIKSLFFDFLFSRPAFPPVALLFFLFVTYCYRQHFTNQPDVSFFTRFFLR